MTRHARWTACIALSCLLAGCAAAPPAEAPPPEPDGLRVSLEDVLAPAIAERDGSFAIAPGTEGLWVALPGLASPERGLVTAPGTGRSVVAALFPATGTGATVSEDLATRLGLGGADPRLTVVALRQEARIVTNESASSPRGF